jgi:hypothetical protein
MHPSEVLKVQTNTTSVVFLKAAVWKAPFQHSYNEYAIGDDGTSSITGYIANGHELFSGFIFIRYAFI